MVRLAAEDGGAFWLPADRRRGHGPPVQDLHREARSRTMVAGGANPVTGVSLAS